MVHNFMTLRPGNDFLIFSLVVHIFQALMLFSTVRGHTEPTEYLRGAVIFLMHLVYNIDIDTENFMLCMKKIIIEKTIFTMNVRKLKGTNNKRVPNN